MDNTIAFRKVSGIYEIRNTVNGKRYIGSAVNIHDRWMRHKNELRKGIHHNPYLQNAWNSYGEDYFLFSVLQETGKEELINIEQDYVIRLCPEYNINNVVTSPMMGRRHREESKNKISNSHMGMRPSFETIKKLISSHLGKMASEETKKRMSESSKDIYRGWADKEVLKYSKDGVLIERYKSIMDAERKTGVVNTSISRCCKGGRPTAGGFVWRYAESK